jgi:pimeloyl-ACP methyl ester carboxylesterase
MKGPSPATAAVLRELAGFREFPRLAWHAPALARRPRGTGVPVLVLPGRSADDLSTVPLRSYLQLLGHAPRGWGLGINDGDFRRLVPAVAAHAARLADRAGRAIPLVGQSLGGSIAREVGRARPDLVSRVITLGSPIMTVQARRPLRCPLTVIYSEADQIVPPRWALADGDGAEVVRVTSTHLAMGFDPDVWAIVADRLALDEPPRARAR